MIETPSGIAYELLPTNLPQIQKIDKVLAD